MDERRRLARERQDKLIRECVEDGVPVTEVMVLVGTGRQAVYSALYRAGWKANGS